MHKCNELIVKNLQFGMQIVGLDVGMLDRKFNWRSLLVVLVTHSVIISFIFVALSAVPITNKLEALCVTFLIVQGSHKFWSTYICSKYFYRIFRQLHDLHTKYVTNPIISKELKKICSYWIVIAIALAVCYCSVAAVYYLYPVYMWKVHHVQLTIIPIPLPGFDWRTPIGYAINLCHQVMLIMIGLIGLVAADVTFLHQVLHTIGYLKILNYRATRLDDTLQQLSRDLNSIEKQFYDTIKAY